jgi:hypothetical protein
MNLSFVSAQDEAHKLNMPKASLWEKQLDGIFMISPEIFRETIKYFKNLL